MTTDLGICDAARCGARAYITAISPITARTLSLCAHHFARNEQALADAGWIIEDRRHELEKTR